MSFKKKMVIAFACLLLLALWAWFTRPISVSDRLKDRQLVQVSASYDVSTPGANGRETFSEIYTHDQNKMQEVIALMNQFSCNRKLFGRSPTSPTTSVTYMMWISLYYQTKDKKDGILAYLVESDGPIMIADWKEHFHEYGVGRFGTQKGREYYQKMKELFDKEQTDSCWQKSLMDDSK